MKKQSWRRAIIRQTMKKDGLTFADRLRESVRTGKPVAHVAIKREGKKFVAVAQ